MTTSTVFVLASDGSFGVSLLFFGPVALLLLALGALTLRDRRRAREDPCLRQASGGRADDGGITGTPDAWRATAFGVDTETSG